MKFLCVVYNDSSLYFAVEFARMMASRGMSLVLVQLRMKGSDEPLSARQWELARHSFNCQVWTESQLINALLKGGFDAVASSGAPRPLRHVLRRHGYRMRRKRPCYIIFQPGVELTLHIGFAARQDFDVVCMNNLADAYIYERSYKLRKEQKVLVGSPFFIIHERFAPRNGARDVYFFPQAVSPTTFRGRLQICRLLVGLAERNPHRIIYIKLRNLSDENSGHIHREDYSYEHILDVNFSNRPNNLKMTACTTQEAIARAAYCITCTSTAGMQAIAAGVPTAFYVDYPDFWMDRLNAGMRRVLSGSNLTPSIADILSLQLSQPNPSWIKAHFQAESILDELLMEIDHFHRSRRSA